VIPLTNIFNGFIIIYWVVHLNNIEEEENMQGLVSFAHGAKIALLCGISLAFATSFIHQAREKNWNKALVNGVKIAWCLSFVIALILFVKAFS
jgi:hypothetical protein